MNETRLKNVYFHIRSHEDFFDMTKDNRDFAYYAACVAVGEDLHGRRVTEYRGQETHIHEIATAFLQASEEEAERLIFLGQWPDPAWQLYRRGQRMKGLLWAINSFITS